MDIRVTATIENEGEKVDIESIINTVIDDTKKFTIRYNRAEITKDTSDSKTVSYKLDNTDEIVKEIVGNVYFIFNDKKLLYVGKAKNLKNRLRQHLINCSSSTSSKIQSVHECLTELEKNGNPLLLSYCAISIKPEKYYGTVEGMIIDYIHSNKDYFKDNWNLRED